MHPLNPAALVDPDAAEPQPCDHPESEWEMEARDPDVGIFSDCVWCGVCGAEARDIEDGYIDGDGSYAPTTVREWEPLIQVACCGDWMPETVTTLKGYGSSPTCLENYGCNVPSRR